MFAECNTLVLIFSQCRHHLSHFPPVCVYYSWLQSLIWIKIVKIIFLLSICGGLSFGRLIVVNLRWDFDRVYSKLKQFQNIELDFALIKYFRNQWESKMWNDSMFGISHDTKLFLCCGQTKISVCLWKCDMFDVVI